jgi:hypothetical protein
MSSSVLKRDIALWVVAAALVALYVAVGGGGFPLDDSWIHQTFARNLATRGEWSFLPGQATAASTSPLYTVLLAIGYFLNLPYALWTHFLGVVALAYIGSVGLRLTLVMLPRRYNTGLFVGLALVGTWHLVWAAAAGMETALFALLTFWLMYRTVLELEMRRYTVRHAMMFGVGAALAVLARPEGILAVGVCGLVLLVFDPRRWRSVVLFGVIAFIAFLAVLSPYLALNLQLTGGLLPNTAAAKFEQHEFLLAQPLTTRIGRLLLAILAGGQILLLAGIVAYCVGIYRQRKRAIWLLPLVWATLLVLLYAVRLPADYQHGRYVIPALPCIVWSGVMGLAWWLERGRFRLWSRIASRVLGLASVLAFVFFLFTLGLQAYRTDIAVINEEMVASAYWIRDNLPQDELLAIHDIGAVGYFSGRTDMLDIAGLIDPKVVNVLDDPNDLWALMRERDAKYLMAFPDQVPGRDVSDSRLCVLFTTNATTAIQQGAANMSVYRLEWDEDCYND